MASILAAPSVAGTASSVFGPEKLATVCRRREDGDDHRRSELVAGRCRHLDHRVLRACCRRREWDRRPGVAAAVGDQGVEHVAEAVADLEDGTARAVVGRVVHRLGDRDGAGQHGRCRHEAAEAGAEHLAGPRHHHQLPARTTGRPVGRWCGADGVADDVHALRREDPARRAAADVPHEAQLSGRVGCPGQPLEVADLVGARAAGRWRGDLEAGDAGPGGAPHREGPRVVAVGGEGRPRGRRHCQTKWSTARHRW